MAAIAAAAAGVEDVSELPERPGWSKSLPPLDWLLLLLPPADSVDHPPAATVATAADAESGLSPLLSTARPATTKAAAKGFHDNILHVFTTSRGRGFPLQLTL